MKRLILSMICVLIFIGIALSVSSAMADDNKDRRENVTVSFGQWDPNDPALIPTNPGEVPLDRLNGDPAGGRGNNHEVLPNVAKIRAGDSVSFIISGGHVVAIYDDGTQPEDINLTNVEVDDPSTPVNEACSTAAGGVLSDSNGRIYRGPCFANINLPSPPLPATLPASVLRRDGVEVVQFTKPGTYLVICARKNHFFNPNLGVAGEFEMFGFVEVKKAK
jgi:hypothetical protein